MPLFMVLSYWFFSKNPSENILLLCSFILSSQGPIEHLLYTRCRAWHLECDYKLNRHILCLHQVHNLVQETDIKQANRDIYN